MWNIARNVRSVIFVETAKNSIDCVQCPVNVYYIHWSDLMRATYSRYKHDITHCFHVFFIDFFQRSFSKMEGQLVSKVAQMPGVWTHWVHSWTALSTMYITLSKWQLGQFGETMYFYRMLINSLNGNLAHPHLQGGDTRPNALLNAPNKCTNIC